MDKNKFWLGGRCFNMASQGLGARTQRKARPQDGHPNATQGMSASWAPQCNARHVRKLGTPTHNCNANATHVRNARHVRTSATWAPQRNTRHVRKLGAPTQRKARPQVGRPNATQGEFARWAPKRKTHPQRKHPHKGALGEKTSYRMDKK